MHSRITHCKRGHEYTPDNTYTAPKTKSRYCKQCRDEYKRLHPNIYEPVQAKTYRDKWNQKNPEYFKHHWLTRAYGLTPDEYEAMWHAQLGKCAICLHDLHRDKSTHVDHNHSTGAVRDPLCQTCNHGIGAFKDDPVIAQNAMKYLIRHEGYGLPRLL
jgi:hypothetical protein